jgi:hypothetical protein
MAGTVCQFVDALADNPNIRFDCDTDPITLLLRGTKIGAAPLNQAFNPSLMVDGGIYGSSAYGPRELVLAMLIDTSDINDAHLLIATLNRELDRDTNLLRWQPDGAAHPVFFQTMRAQPADVDMEMQPNGLWNVTASLQAKPFAIGLREDLAAITFANAVSGTDCYSTITGVLGDVPAPVLAWSTTKPDANAGWYLVRGDTAPVLFEIDTWTNGTDTTNVTSDATYSNSAGKSVSFATATAMTIRAQATSLATPMSGTYRVLLRVKQSSGTDAMSLQVTLQSTGGNALVDTGEVTVPTGSTAFRTVDLGLISCPAGTILGMNAITTELYGAFVAARRVSGAGTLQIDWLALVPAGDGTESSIVTAPSEGTALVIDAIGDTEFFVNTSSPFTAGADVSIVNPAQRSGTSPSLKPGQTNHLVFLRYGIAALTDTTSLNVSYWPRYLFVRPAAS